MEVRGWEVYRVPADKVGIFCIVRTFVEIAQNLFRPLPVPRPQADGGQRRAAHPGEGGKGGDQHQDREGHPQPGEGGAAYHCNVADVDAVHDVVEHIDELGRHGGQGQLEHQRADGGAGERLLASVGLGQAFSSNQFCAPPSEPGRVRVLVLKGSITRI